MEYTPQTEPIERNEIESEEELSYDPSDDDDPDLFEPETVGAAPKIEESEPENGQKTVKNGQVATQFKQGNPGGPGRPRKPKTLEAIMRKWLFAGENEDAKRVLNALFERAIEGNVTAIKLILDYSKPKGQGLGPGAKEEPPA